MFIGVGTSGVVATARTATTTNNCTAQDAVSKGGAAKVISNDQGTCDVAGNSTSNLAYGYIAFSVASGGTTDLADLETPRPTDAPPPTPSDRPESDSGADSHRGPTPTPTPSDGPSPSPTGGVLGTSTSTPDTGAGSGTMFGTGIALLVLGFGLVFGIPRRRNKSNL